MKLRDVLSALGFVLMGASLFAGSVSPTLGWGLGIAGIIISLVLETMK